MFQFDSVPKAVRQQHNNEKEKNKRRQKVNELKTHFSCCQFHFFKLLFGFRFVLAATNELNS